MIAVDKTTVTPQDNGPLNIEGSFTIVDATGDTYETKTHVSLCRCGSSDNKPFCDGTHEVIDFESAPRVNDLMVEV